jgi:lysophospholipase
MTASVLPLTFWALASLRFANAEHSYVPKTDQPCPDNLLRQPPVSHQTLHPNEYQYLADRRKLFPDAWRDWVGDCSHLGYDLNKLGMTAYDGSGLPVIGIAVSGGGHRCVSDSVAYRAKTDCLDYSAAQFGAGIISGLDARNTTAKAKGTGGLLQVSSYMSALSGGSWLAASMLFNNFPDLHSLVLGDTAKGGKLSGWLLERDLFVPDGTNLTDPENTLYFGYVAGFSILYTRYIHLSTGIFSGA